MESDLGRHSQSIIEYDSAPFSFTGEILIGVIFFSISIFGTLGNILLITALRKNKRLHSASNLLTISLAASDLLLAMVAIPIFGYAAIHRHSTKTKDYSSRYNVTVKCTHMNDQRLSDFLCSLNGFLIYVSSKISTWTLAGMAVERYIAVLLPLKYNRVVKQNRMVGFIITIWLLSIVLELPQAVLDWFPYVYYHNAYGCLSPSYHHMQYTHIGFTVFSISKKLILSEMPLMLIGFCYYRILQVSFKSKDFELDLKIRFNKKDNDKDTKRLDIKRTTAEKLSMFQTNSIKSQQVINSDQHQLRPRPRKLASSHSLAEVLQKTQLKVTHYKKSSIWLIIILSFFLCWTPISLIGIAMNFADAYCENSFPRGVVITLCILAIINCCVNPIVYGLLHQQIRTTFKDILYCKNTANRIRQERQEEYLGHSQVTRASHAQIINVSSALSNEHLSSDHDTSAERESESSPNYDSLILSNSNSDMIRNSPLGDGKIRTATLNGVQRTNKNEVITSPVLLFSPDEKRSPINGMQMTPPASNGIISIPISDPLTLTLSTETNA